jgi:hypothetical protein
MALYRYERAATLFQESLDLAQVTQSSQKSWSTTYLNLGTCFRKMKSVVEVCADQVVKLICYTTGASKMLRLSISGC